jgi:hypothetical protein
MNTHTKKSQSEILGLAMVMVLIVIGLLMYVVFSLNSAKESITATQQHKQLPVILNDAMLFTDSAKADCYGERMQKLVIKVAQGDAFTCNYQGGTLVEDYVKIMFNMFLTETLDAWNIGYNYTVYTGNDFTDSSSYVMSLSNVDCTYMNRDSENFFFRMSNGKLVNMKLDICT